jgi:hypothetical protein
MQRCHEAFPEFVEMSDAELFRTYEETTLNRHDAGRHWLRVWYLQRLMNARQSEGCRPSVTSAVGALLVFLADEVDRWTAKESRHSPEILNALTGIVEQLSRSDAGLDMDLKAIEHAAIVICVGLELVTGDETTLLRFGQALKHVKRLSPVNKVKISSSFAV